MPVNWIYIIECTRQSTELSETEYDIDGNYFASREDAKKFIRNEIVGFHKALAKVVEEEGRVLELKFFDNLDSMFLSSDFKIVKSFSDRSVTNTYTIKPLKLYTGGSRVHDELDYDGTEEVAEEVPEV